MASKKYWWLKLKSDFFTNKKIKKLRRIAGGDTYVLIYLKMQLLSLKNDGNLYFDGVEDTMIEEIALEIDEDSENVAVTVMYLIKNGLIEEIDDETYSLPETKECIGSETAGAKRVRKHRELGKKGNKTLHCNTSVTKCNTEIEKELEIELDLEKELEIEEKIYSPVETETSPAKDRTSYPYPNIYALVIDYLNVKADTKYRATTKKTQTLIRTRQKEGFKLEDFKKVIDTKVKEWRHDPNMVKYLRPETLFGTKFEGYLNQKEELDRMQKIHNDFEEIRNESNIDIF